MKKYKTIHEETEIRWNKWSKRNHKIHNPEKKEAGCYIKTDGESLMVHEFCSDAGCNVFHADDVSEALYNLREPHTLNWIYDCGRDHSCQFIVRDTHYFKVFASGYGCGDGISFSKGFPHKLKYLILRELARDHTFDMLDNYISYEDKGDHYRRRKIELATVRDIINNWCRCKEDLMELTKMVAIIKQRRFYRGIKKCDSFYEEFRKSREQNLNDFKKIKLTKVYKEFQKYLRRNKNGRL